MKRFIKYIAVFTVPFILGSIILFLIPLEKKFSYHFVKGECDNKASWIYNRIYEKTENIDIAFSGASQTACAFMDEYIENKLRDNGKDLKVANLGYCRRGRDIQYVMLKDLFGHKNPKLLIIEVPEDEPKKSHPVFPYLAETTDLFGSFILFNHHYFSNILKGLIVRFEQLRFKVFNSGNFSNHHKTDFGYIHSEQVVSQEIIQQNAEIWKKRLSGSKPEIIRKTELHYSNHYLEKITKLASQNNCKVLFVYLPESGSKVKIPFQNEFYHKFGNVIFLPDSIINNRTNWQDATHFNDSGAKKVSGFVLNKLINHQFQ
jgi:hypothetical protein